MNRLHRHQNIILLFFLLAIFLTSMILFYPFRFVFEMDGDEGLVLMRSFMLGEGYPLYTTVTNDQPPIFTLLLTAVFRFFGYNVTIARLFVLAFSSLLLVSSLAYLSIFWGQPHAVFALLMFFLIPRYNRLSVSVMIGLPAIALATTSFLLLILWHQHRKLSWLVTSAIVLALSMMTKLFTGILIPIFFVGLLAAEYKNAKDNRSWVELLKPALIWSATLGLIILSILLFFVGIGNIDQLIEIHLTVRDAEEFALRARNTNINYYLQGAWAIILAAAFGTGVAIWKRKWTALYLTAWCIAAYIFLFSTVPVWDHHQLLVTVPVAMLSAIGFGEITLTALYTGNQNIRARDRFILILIGALLFSITLSTRLKNTISEFNPNLPNIYRPESGEDQEFEVLAIMSDRTDEMDVVITDRPIFAFRIQKEVPSELVVFSAKRLESGSITEEQIINIIERDQPRLILVARFGLSAVVEYIGDRYDSIYVLGKFRLYESK